MGQEGPAPSRARPRRTSSRLGGARRAGNEGTPVVVTLTTPTSRLAVTARVSVLGLTSAAPFIIGAPSVGTSIIGVARTRTRRGQAREGGPSAGKQEATPTPVSAAWARTLGGAQAPPRGAKGGLTSF